MWERRSREREKVHKRVVLLASRFVLERGWTFAMGENVEAGLVGSPFWWTLHTQWVFVSHRFLGIWYEVAFVRFFTSSSIYTYLNLLPPSDRISISIKFQCTCSPCHPFSISTCSIFRIEKRRHYSPAKVSMLTSNKPLTHKFHYDPGCCPIYRIYSPTHIQPYHLHSLIVKIIIFRATPGSIPIQTFDKYFSHLDSFNWIRLPIKNPWQPCGSRLIESLSILSTIIQCIGYFNWLGTNTIHTNWHIVNSTSHR